MLAVVATVVGVAHAFGLRLNLTPSLPRGVYAAAMFQTHATIMR